MDGGAQAAEKFLFKFDRLPPTLNSLLRMHWTKRGEAIDAWAWHLKFQASELGLAGRQILVCNAVFKVKGLQQMDDDNLWARFKVVGDALQRANIIVSDKPKNLRLSVSWEAAKRRKNVGCTLELEVIEWATT